MSFRHQIEILHARSVSLRSLDQARFANGVARLFATLFAHLAMNGAGGRGVVGDLDRNLVRGPAAQRKALGSASEPPISLPLMIMIPPRLRSQVLSRLSSSLTFAKRFVWTPHPTDEQAPGRRHLPPTECRR
jgi:hypothetical protein